MYAILHEETWDAEQYNSRESHTYVCRRREHSFVE